MPFVTFVQDFSSWLIVATSVELVGLDPRELIQAAFKAFLEVD